MSFGARAVPGLVEGGETPDDALPAGKGVGGKTSGFSLGMDGQGENAPRLGDDTTQVDSTPTGNFAFGATDGVSPGAQGMPRAGDIALAVFSQRGARTSGPELLPPDVPAVMDGDAEKGPPRQRESGADPQAALSAEPLRPSVMQMKNGVEVAGRRAVSPDTSKEVTMALTAVDTSETAGVSLAMAVGAVVGQAEKSPQASGENRPLAVQTVGSLRHQSPPDISSAMPSGAAVEKVSFHGDTATLEAARGGSKKGDLLLAMASPSAQERSGAATTAVPSDRVQVRVIPASPGDRGAAEVAELPRMALASDGSPEHAAGSGNRAGVEPRPQESAPKIQIPTASFVKSLSDHAGAAAVVKSPEVVAETRRLADGLVREVRPPDTDANAGMASRADTRTLQDDRGNRLGSVADEPAAASRTAANRPAYPAGALPPASAVSLLVEAASGQADMASPSGDPASGAFLDNPDPGQLSTTTSADGARRTAEADLRQPNLARAITQQVTEAIKLPVDGGVEIRLSPDELGRVKLSMLPGETGMVVQLVAERPETLDLLRRHADVLAAELRDAGYSGLEFSFSGERRPTSSTADVSDEPPPEPDIPATSAQRAARHLAPDAGPDRGLDIRL